VKRGLVSTCLLTVVLALAVASAPQAQLGGLGGGIGGGGVAGGLGGGTEPAESPWLKAPVWLAVGPVTVPADQEIDGLVAIGPITVSGKVMGDVTSFGGRIVLEKTAVVAGHVTAVCASIEKAEGAQVGGEVRPNQIPEVAITQLDPQQADAAVLLIGTHEITARDGGRYIVLGGDVTVKAQAKAAAIMALGGTVTLEEGAEVGLVRGVGATVKRAGAAPREPDALLDPLVLPCGGHGVSTGAAMASSLTTLRRSTASVALEAHTGEQSSGNSSVWSSGGPLQVGVTLTIKGARRFGPFMDDPEYPWPRSVLDDREQASPLLRESAVAGAAVSISASLGGEKVGGPQPTPPEGEQRSFQQSVTLAVPANAAVLARPAGFGYGGASFGGYSTYGTFGGGH
jgi:hypothetical protein